MIFASKNAFNLFTQSRRDDLISLCYLLVYLIDGDLTFLTKEDQMEDSAMLSESQPAPDLTSSNGGEHGKIKEDEFVRLRRAKNTLSPEQLCDSEESLLLLPFMKEIMGYRFNEQPNYDKLRCLLLKILLDQNEEPDNAFDWNEGYVVEDEQVPSSVNPFAAIQQKYGQTGQVSAPLQSKPQEEMKASEKAAQKKETK